MRWAAAMALACGACAVEPVGGEAVAIVGGAPETAMPAVVAVINRATGGLCTGTLVSPWIVLTAKHCVIGPGEEALYPPGDFVVGLGDRIDAFEQTFDVVATATTPGVWTATDSGSVAGALVNVDIGVMTLGSPADVAPIPILRDLPGLPGGPVTSIGFGGRPGGGIGEKWSTTVDLIARTGYVLVGPPAVCGGDSGGPLLDASGALVAVASLGPSDCGTGESAYNVVQPFLELIDGAIDDALRCDPFAPESSPDGWYCARRGCEGTFETGEPGEASWGEPCDRDTDCVTLQCVDPGDGVRRCLGSCRADAGECADGEACAAVPGGCGACVAAELLSPRGLGETCERDDDCRSGRCHRERLGIRYCTRPCDAGCPSGFDCAGGACVRDDARADLSCSRVPDGGLACDRPPLVASGGGGCAASGQAPGGTWPILALAIVLRRRRR